MLTPISRRTFLAITGAALGAPQFCMAANEVPAVLDHILFGCNDLDKGVAFVEQQTGVHAVFGGVHPGRGTRNALLSLGGEKHYLEIIAPDPAQANSTEPLSVSLKKLTAPRLVGWAAHPGDLEVFAKRLLDAKLAFEGPRPGSRNRPDGRLLSWKTLTLANDQHGLLPFFIEWGADSIHPSVDAPAGCNIERFDLFGPNTAELTRLCKLLGLDVSVNQGDRPQLRTLIKGSKGQFFISS